MQTTVIIIFIVVFLIVFVMLMRVVGSWMLRIDDVIKELKAIRTEIAKKN